jgi:hypothetical protein
MRYSGPQLLSSWLHGAAPRQPSCQLPRRARAVGPAELTVRLRLPGIGDLMVREKLFLVGVLVIALGVPAPGSPEGSLLSECEMAGRYREIAEFFLGWAMSGEEHPELGVFWDHDRLASAESVAVNCPFVPARQFLAVHERFMGGWCCEWGLSGFEIGRCVQLTLTIETESEDEIVVSFVLGWAMSAGRGSYYTCSWEKSQLRVTKVPNRMLII